MMEGERQNKEVESNSPKMERKQRGKFVSLSKLEAKMLLETYVKRSLSNREGKRTGYRKEKAVQRSISDVHRFAQGVNKSNVIVVPQTELKETERKDNETHLSTHEPATVAKAKNVKKQSWFKRFVNQLFKREENTSEQTVQDSITSSTEGNSEHTTKRNSFRKSSFRRALSFKKTNADEKLKRPTNLPLKHTCRPRPLQPLCLGEKNEDCYYEQVSAEIELLVKDTENLGVGGRKQSFSTDLNTDGAQNMETTIKKIVAILQKQGDAYDRKIKEDPALSNFFRDISYSSFKQLADVYVDKEVKNRDLDATPEDMKFAFSIHFTKQVVGLSTHPANRIMGFGTKYLQDTFTLLSYSRENLTMTADPEACISPD